MGKILIVGTKPPRPHLLANQVRVELWNTGEGGKVPALRMRDENAGAIAVMTFDEFVNIRDQMSTLIDIMEEGAEAEAKGALDGIVAAFKSKPKEGK